MGRIGSGEWVTLVLGLVAPITYFLLGAVLIVWARRQQRMGRGSLAHLAFYSAVGAIASALLGGLWTVQSLIQVFGGVASLPPSERTLALSTGIAESMGPAGVGLGLSAMLYAVSATANLVAAFRAPSSG